jgi:uncharacterized lipoprotein YddW (UPF0748 family)
MVKLAHIMNKRTFLKSLGIGLGALAPISLSSTAQARAQQAKPKAKKAGFQVHAWMGPDHKEPEAQIRSRFKKYAAAGIRAIYFESDSEKHFRIAKECGIEAHRWFWTMNRGDATLLKEHPEWYSISKTGQSCADNPPYVGYYRFLCPNKPEVLEHLKKQVRDIVQRPYIDGVHLDYIRFVDVILPSNLWDNYNLDQSKELPQFDFCYCSTCCNKYEAQYGISPLDMEYPDQSPSWRKFRYDSITQVVNALAKEAQAAKKPISAAVFPTPEIAKRIVRQDWVNWDMDAIYPMIYHGFYKEPVAWIGDAVQEGVQALHGKFPLYAGLYIPDFKSNDELKEGIRLAKQQGAAGVSIFGNLSDEVLAVLKSFK